MGCIPKNGQTTRAGIAYGSRKNQLFSAPIVESSKFAPTDKIRVGKYPIKLVSSITNGICHTKVSANSMQPIKPFRGDTSMLAANPAAVVASHNRRFAPKTRRIKAIIFPSQILEEDTGKQRIFCIPVFRSRTIMLADNMETKTGRIIVYHQL